MRAGAKVAGVFAVGVAEEGRGVEGGAWAALLPGLEVWGWAEAGGGVRARDGDEVYCGGEGGFGAWAPERCWALVL